MGMLKIFTAIVKVPLSWFRKLYAWTVHWAKSPYAYYALFGIAFAESSFFPIPPDVLLIAMCIANPKKWWVSASVCTLGSVCGAFLGYFIGWGLYETVGKFIVDTYQLQDAVNLVGRKYSENAFLTIFTAAFTPIPYKAITITAGLFKISLLTVTIASIIGRAGRFFLVAGSLRVFGKKIADSIEKYFDIFSLVFVILLIAGILALRYFGK
jgi:membrane protein YqaA with SNARE-associated domain